MAVEPAGADVAEAGGGRRVAQVRGPTIDGVAAEAGVSRATVSRVLNGRRWVSPATLEAVQRALTATGYVANQHARSLVTKRSNALAFVVSEPHDLLFEDPNLGVLLRAATKALADQHMSVVLTMNSGPVDRDRIVRHVRGGHVDGVLLVSTHGDDPLFSQLEAAGIPTVICGRALRSHSALPCVWPDDRGGARQMAEHLVERGYDRITMISGPADTASAVDRIAGFRDVLGRRISKRLIVEAPRYSHGAGETTMAALLEREPTTDAVFVASDLLAAGAINTLRRSGRRVPDDVAVGGFDDSRIALTTDPPLTTIQVPFEAMAEAMVRLITQLITGIEVSSVQFPTQLVVRDSA